VADNDRRLSILPSRDACATFAFFQFRLNSDRRLPRKLPFRAAGSRLPLQLSPCERSHERIHPSYPLLLNSPPIGPSGNTDSFLPRNVPRERSPTLPKNTQALRSWQNGRRGVPMKQHATHDRGIARSRQRARQCNLVAVRWCLKQPRGRATCSRAMLHARDHGC